MKKAFQRTCTGCNAKKDRYELIRIVKTKDNEVLIDKKGNLQGRGAYICNSIECLNKAIKTNKIFKTLKINTNKKIYEDIRGVILGKENKTTKLL